LTKSYNSSIPPQKKSVMPGSSPSAVDYLAKAEAIRPRVDHEERVTVDASELNAEVISCTDHVVELGLETFLPHSRQKVVVPLREVTISTDPGRHTRNPDRPFKNERLRLIIDRPRPTGI
jgi:phage/plasmid-associated DNA primase